MQQSSSKNQGQACSTALIIVVLSLTTLVAAIDTNIVNIGLPTIAKALHTGFQGVQWVTLSYMLAVTALIVGIGSIGDIFGKKRIFTAGILIFTMASLLCGFSTSISMLITLRAIQGIGGAILMALSFAIVGDLVPQDKIIGSMGVLTSMLPIGFAISPTVGGLLLRVWSWRSLFFFNVPLGLLAFILVLRFPEIPITSKSRRFDLPGMLLLAFTLICYILAITSTENEGVDRGVLLLFAASVVGLVMFLLREHAERENSPLVSLSMFKSRTFSASLGVSVLVYSVMTGNWLIVPFYLQQAMGFSTFTCGLMMTMGPVGCAIFTPISSRLADRFGNFIVMKLGVLAFACGALLMSTLNIHSSAVTFDTILFFFNGSIAFFQTPNNASVISMARPEQRGVASGLLNLARTIGQTSGTALIGAFFYFFLRTKSIDQATPAQIVSSFHNTYLIATAIAFAAFFIGLGLLSPKKGTEKQRDGI